MKLGYALSLSLEGIRLFHRSTDSWDEVGVVPLDSAELVADLAALRDKGLALSPDGDGRILCKIIIPNALVRYIALDNPRADDAAVRAALEGATPYALSELAYDHCAGGGRMHIAAVARENLHEAEIFASEHGFTPLIFVATPEPYTFPGEVNFGPTRLAAAVLPAGVEVETEGDCVPMPAQQFASEVHAPVADPATAEAETDAPEDTAQAPPADLPATDDSVKAEAPPDAAEPAPAAPPADTGGKPAADTAPGTTPATPKDSDTPEDKGIKAPPHPPAIFASRSRPQGLAPAEISHSAKTKGPTGKKGAPAPQDISDKESTATPEPVFASRAQRLKGDAAKAPTRREPSLTSKPKPAAASGKGTPTVPPPVTAPVAPPPAPQEKAKDPAAARVVPLAAPLRPATGATQTAESSPARTMPGQHAARGITPSAVPEPARPKRRIGLGLMLMLLLIAALAAVALWSTTLDGGLAGMFEREDRAIAGAQDSDSPSASPVAAAGEAEPIATSGLDPATEAGPAADSLSPEQAADPEPDADLTLTSADDLATPAATAPGLTEPASGDDIAIPAEAMQSDSEGRLNREDMPATAGDDGRDALAIAAGAAPSGTLVTPEDADRIYEATGVWLRAPRLPLLPKAEELSDLAMSAADPSRQAISPADLLQGPGIAPDAGIPAQPDPPPPGTTLTRDARGLIVATATGIMLPTGITLFAGEPPRVPPTRPGTPPPPPAIEAAVAVSASGIRPPARPDTVLEAAIEAGMVSEEAASSDDALPDDTLPDDTATEADESTTDPDDAAAADIPAGGVALALSAPDLRPATRPQSIVPPPAWEGKAPPNRPASFASLATGQAGDNAADAAVEAALSAISETTVPLEGVTANAVPQALRPDMRPRNFDRVVETQTELVARASTAAAQEAATEAAASQPVEQQTAAAAPAEDSQLTREEAAESTSSEVSNAAAPAAGPTPGGVATAATVSRAINLREVNLIGVFGPQSARRALVRLANGRLVRVGVGDSLDGGQVLAIGDSFLNYSKRGRTHTLHVPG